MKFDPENPPKFCPECQQNGRKSKVKMKRLIPNTEKKLICKHKPVRTFNYFIKGKICFQDNYFLSLSLYDSSKILLLKMFSFPTLIISFLRFVAI